MWHGFCRWYQATKSNTPTMAARIDSLKDEMDEALNKVEMCKVGSALQPTLWMRLASDLHVLAGGEERGTLLQNPAGESLSSFWRSFSLHEKFLCDPNPDPNGLFLPFLHVSLCIYNLRVPTLQDQLSADMYSFASKEAGYARYYVMVSTFTQSHSASTASLEILC